MSDVINSPNFKLRYINANLQLAELEAYDPESEGWQKQFSRRYTHHSEMLNVLENMEDVNETVYSKFAVSVTPYMAKLDRKSVV